MNYAPSKRYVPIPALGFFDFPPQLSFFPFFLSTNTMKMYFLTVGPSQYFGNHEFLLLTFGVHPKPYCLNLRITQHIFHDALWSEHACLESHPS